jgi:hypothetical protein
MLHRLGLVTLFSCALAIFASSSCTSPAPVPCVSKTDKQSGTVSCICGDWVEPGDDGMSVAVETDSCNVGTFQNTLCCDSPDSYCRCDRLVCANAGGHCSCAAEFVFDLNGDQLVDQCTPPEGGHCCRTAASCACRVEECSADATEVDACGVQDILGCFAEIGLYRVDDCQDPEPAPDPTSASAGSGVTTNASTDPTSPDPTGLDPTGADPTVSDPTGDEPAPTWGCVYHRTDNLICSDGADYGQPEYGCDEVSGSEYEAQVACNERTAKYLDCSGGCCFESYYTGVTLQPNGC